MCLESEFVWSNEAMPYNKNAEQVFTEVCGPKRLPESVKDTWYTKYSEKHWHSS